MSIILTPESFSLSIAGLDCTDLLVEVKANYSNWNPGSGIIVSTATFTLRDTHEFREVLDDRRNGRFSNGRQVVFKINDELAPVCGVHYIENAIYDGEQLVITTTDLLGITNTVTPGELGVCITLSEETQVRLAVRSLLLKAGIPQTFLDLSRFASTNLALFETQNVPQGSSLVNLAGQIVHSMGYVLYQRNDGTVTTGDFTSLLRKRIAIAEDTFNLTSYERVQASELPPSKVIVSGQVANKFYTDKVKAYTTIKPTPLGTETLVRNVETDHESRKIVSISENRAPEGNVIPQVAPNSSVPILRNYTEEIALFEGSGNPNTPLVEAESGGGVEVIPDEDCTKKDEARIYQRVTRVISDFRVALQAWQEIGLQAGTIESIEVGNVVESILTEDYEYNTPDLEVIEYNNTLNTNSNSFLSEAGSYQVVATRSLERAIGAEVPIFARYIDGSISEDITVDPGSSSLVLNPRQLILVQYEQTVWKLDTNYNTWTMTRKVFQTKYSQQPEQIQAMLANQDRYPLGTTLATATSLMQVSEETQEDSSPPNFGRMPPEATVQYTPYKATYDLLDSSKANRRVLNYSLGDYTNTADDSLAIAETFGRWEAGRYKAMNIVMPLSLINSLSYPNMVPLIRTAVIRESNINTNIHYAIDGLNLFFSPEEAYIAFTGLFLGSEGAVPITINTKTVKPGQGANLPFGGGGDIVDLRKLGYPTETVTGLTRNTALKDGGIPESLSSGGGGTYTGGNTNYAPSQKAIDSEEDMDDVFGSERVPLPSVGEKYPNIKSSYDRLSSSDDPDLEDGAGGGNPFQSGGSHGGHTYRRPEDGTQPRPSANFNQPTTQQDYYNGNNPGGDESGGGGGGGGAIGGGGTGIRDPIGQPSVQPSNDEWGSGFAGGSGGSTGGSVGFIGGNGGGGGGGITGEGYTPGFTSPFNLKMSWQLSTAFPNLLTGLPPSLNLPNVLANSEGYFDVKSLTLTSL